MYLDAVQSGEVHVAPIDMIDKGYTDEATLIQLYEFITCIMAHENGGLHENLPSFNTYNYVFAVM